MTELNFAQMEQLNGGKFWGWGGCGSAHDEQINEFNGYLIESCLYTCSYYVFGIPVDTRDFVGPC